MAPAPFAAPAIDGAFCAAIADRVRGLAGHWRRRSAVAPFYTLGTAVYLDQRYDYMARAAATNPVLGPAFADLHQQLCDVLGHVLAAPVHLARTFAVPGFHIYEPHPFFALPLADLHWDRQHRQVAWPGGPPREDAVLSVTLPVSLPRGGAGLEIWPRHRFEDGEASRAAAFADPGKGTVYPYSLGELLIHDGQSLHRAEMMPNRRFDTGEPDDDLRITLQGHLARFDGTWEFYW